MLQLQFVPKTPSCGGSARWCTFNCRPNSQRNCQCTNHVAKHQNSLKHLPENSSDGAQVRLGDVARVELGSDNYQFDSKFNGSPAGGVAIKLATGANALDTAAAVEKRLSELRHNYPSGLKDKLAV